MDDVQFDVAALRGQLARWMAFLALLSLVVLSIEALALDASQLIWSIVFYCVTFPGVCFFVYWVVLSEDYVRKHLPKRQRPLAVVIISGIAFGQLLSGEVAFHADRSLRIEVTATIVTGVVITALVLTFGPIFNRDSTM